MAAKKVRTLHEKIAARLREVSADKEGNGLIEATTSTESILSDVKFVLKLGLDPYDDLVGGVTFGRIYEWFGLEGCGKSALCIRAAAQANDGEIYERIRLPDNSFELKKLDKDDYELSILYIDNEGSLDGSEYIEVHGKRIDVVIARAETIDAVFKCMDETIDILTKVEAEESKKANHKPKKQYLLVIVDTIAGTSSKEELTQAWGKDDYARQPKAMHEGMRIMSQKIQRENVCVICTNQATDNIGYKEFGFAKPIIPDHEQYRASGGKALKYWSTNRMFLAPVRKNYKMTPDSKYPDGVATGFRSVKNRIKPPLREGLLVLLYDRTGFGGFNNELSILETLIFYGFAEDDYKAKEIVFKFRLNGIEPTTFPDLMKSLAEQDAEAGGKGKKEKYKDPRIKTRAGFSKFYAEHRADFDAMWKKLLERAFLVRGIHGESAETEPTDGGSAEEVSDQPEEETPKQRGGRRNPLAEMAEKV